MIECVRQCLGPDSKRLLAHDGMQHLGFAFRFRMKLYGSIGDQRLTQYGQRCDKLAPVHLRPLLRRDRGIAAAQAFFCKALATNLNRWPQGDAGRPRAESSSPTIASTRRSVVAVRRGQELQVPPKAAGWRLTGLSRWRGGTRQ